MKYLKTYENINNSAKDEIYNIIDNIYVELEKTYLNSGDKEYSYSISEESKKFATYKILNLINTIFNKKLNLDFDEIMSYLNEPEISQEDEEEIDEES